MNTIDLKILPSKIVFIIWLQHIIHNKRAKFSLTHENVIVLNSGISGVFGFGRDVKTNHPIIAAPKSFIPWFFIGDINRVLIIDGNSIYLEFGNPPNSFYIKISTTKTRLKCLITNTEDTLDLVKTVDMHGYSLLNDNTVELSKALGRAPIQILKSLDEITTPINENPVDWSSNLNQEYDIYNVNNFDLLKDPLIY